MFFQIKTFALEKYRALTNSEHSFVLMMFCNRLIGFLTNPDGDSDYLRPVKFLTISFTVMYEFVEVISLVIAIKSTGLDNHIGSFCLVCSRLFSMVVWSSLAIHQHDLKQIWVYLMRLQRDTPDKRRYKNIRRINGFLLLFLLQELVPIVVWFIKGHSGSPLSFYESELINKLNSVVYPVTLFSLTLTFCYSLIVISSIIMALTLEFHILGYDFEHVFDKVGRLEVSDKNATQNWSTLEFTFKAYAVRHQILLNIAVKLRNLLKLYSLIQLLVYFLMVVVGSFMYVFTQKCIGVGVVFFAVCVIATSMNLMMYGLLCDLLEDKMLSISHRLYGSGWTHKLVYSKELDGRYKSFRKMMLIVMERSRRSVPLTCGNFVTMSLVTCREVLWFAYSVFTVLVSFLE